MPHWTEWYRWTLLWWLAQDTSSRGPCGTQEDLSSGGDPDPQEWVTMCLEHKVGITQKSILKAWWLNDLKNKTTTPIIWLHIIPIIRQTLSHNLTNHGYLSGKHRVTDWWRGSPKMSSIRWNPSETTNEENKEYSFPLKYHSV